MPKFGMVIDLSRCTGCQTCVVTCQMHNNQRPSVAWGTVDSFESGEWPNADRGYVPHACMHCDNAACVDACTTGASTQGDDGVVLIDYEICMGCETCIEACPYGARQISPLDEWYFDAAEPAPYESEGVQRGGVAEKCIFCHERTTAGEKPYCVQGCFNGVRIFGDVDDPASEISTYIAENNAENFPGTSFYYVKGKHNVNLAEMLMATDDPAESPIEEAKEAINPIAIGAGVAAVVGVGAVAGGAYTYKKKKAANGESTSANTAGKEGE